MPSGPLEKSSSTIRLFFGATKVKEKSFGGDLKIVFLSSWTSRVSMTSKGAVRREIGLAQSKINEVLLDDGKGHLLVIKIRDKVMKSQQYTRSSSLHATG